MKLTEMRNKLCDAETKIDRLRKTHEAFIASLKKYPKSSSISTSLEANEDGIIATIFDIKVVASRRFVSRVGIVAPARFFLEYQFHCDFLGNTLKIWKFYLDEDSNITGNINGEFICDCLEEQKTTDLICHILTDKVLNSKIFQPAED